LREGVLGQHCGLSEHASQSRFNAKYRSMWSTPMLPVVLSNLPAGQV
jgi:hypothetical protein